MSVESDFSKLQYLAQTIDLSMQDGLMSAGELIVQLASEFAPKDTTDLSQSGRVEVDAENNISVVFGAGSTNVSIDDNRAIAQEFGTYSQPAQPYLIPAATQINVAEEVAKIVKSKL